MAFDPREGSFALFPNEYKEHEKQPDFRGSFRLHGKLCCLVAWSRQTRKGDHYLSGQIIELDEQSGFPVGRNA